MRLADVAEMRLGKMLDARKNRGTLFPYLANPNVRWFDVDLNNLKEMRFEEEEEEKFAVRDGDILICEGGEAGRAAIWQGPDIGVKFQKAIHRVRASERLHNRFLVHRLFYDYHTGSLNDYYTGATIKHLTGQDLARYGFPLPPLGEQMRIAAILDQADNLRRLRQRAIDRLNELGQAIFYEMFGDVAHNERKLPVAPISSLIDPKRPITYGILKPGPDLEDGIPYIRVVDIAGGKVLAHQLRRTSPAIAQEYKRSTIKAGDLLISIRGHVGRMAIAPSSCDGANITQDTARLAILGANPEFIKAQLESPFAKGWMARRVRGIAVQGINLGDLRELPIVLPPLEKQNLFEERINVVTRQLEAQSGQLLTINALFSSLQHRAFTNQL